jgi:hypothetical protein
VVVVRPKADGLPPLLVNLTEKPPLEFGRGDVVEGERIQVAFGKAVLQRAGFNFEERDPLTAAVANDSRLLVQVVELALLALGWQEPFLVSARHVVVVTELRRHRSRPDSSGKPHRLVRPAATPSDGLSRWLYSTTPAAAALVAEDADPSDTCRFHT